MKVNIDFVKPKEGEFEERDAVSFHLFSYLVGSFYPRSYLGNNSLWECAGVRIMRRVERIVLIAFNHNEIQEHCRTTHRKRFSDRPATSAR